MTDERKDISFEETLEQLEALVKSMESGELPLDSLVEKFEQGNKLASMCEKRLKQAELKIERLREENEKIALEAFEPEVDHN